MSSKDVHVHVYTCMYVTVVVIVVSMWELSVFVVQVAFPDILSGGGLLLAWVLTVEYRKR